MTIQTVTYDDATHKVVPIEPTNEMAMAAVTSVKRFLGLCFHTERARDGYKAMLAAAPELPDAWKDISTAPNDGTNVLVFGTIIGNGCDTYDEPNKIFVAQKNRSFGWETEPSLSYKCAGFEPTLWMPIDPPKENK